MQANVGRSGPANDLLLAMAFEQQMNIILIHKLWVVADLNRKMTKKHKRSIMYTKHTPWKKSGLSGQEF